MISLLACAPLLALAAPKNSEFKIGVAQEFENLNPLIAQQAVTRYIQGFTHRSLWKLGPEWKQVPHLAKKVPTFDNKMARIENKKVIAWFEIREEAKWSDGVPLTCADFAFAREVALHPNVTNPEREVFSMVEKIEWDPAKPKKCTFIYHEPRWDFYVISDFRPLPKHIEESVFIEGSKTPQGYENNSNYVKNPMKPGLSCGPYMVSELKLGSHVTLIPNPHFYGSKPKIQKIIIKLLPNTATMEANLISGTIDAIGSMGISFDQALKLEEKIQSEKLPFQVLFQPSMIHEHIDFNLDNPIFKDVRVRKAFLYGINREDLVRALFKNRQPVAAHSTPPGDKEWYTDDPKKVTIYKFDKKEAARLLDEAGWKLGPTGIRTKDGQKLSVTFMTTAGNKVRENVQVYLQNQWKALGIEVIIRNEPARVFFGESTRKRKFEGLAMYAFMSSPQVPPRVTLHSSNIPTESNSYSGQNFPGWKNSAVDKLLDQLKLELSPSKRVVIAQKIMKEYTDDLPSIPLYFRSDVAAIPKNLKNFKLNGHQYHESNQSEYWDLQ